MIATLINGTIEQGVSYQIYLTGMGGVMLGIFITMVGFMFNNMQAGFEKAALDRKSGFEKVATETKSSFDKVTADAKTSFDKVGNQFDKVTTDVSSEFKGVNQILHSHDLAFTKIETLLSLYLLKDGTTFEEQEKAVKKAQAEMLARNLESSSE
jgi:hypothetical protein